jgi:hypothetical protein
MIEKVRNGLGKVFSASDIGLSRACQCIADSTQNFRMEILFNAAIGFDDPEPCLFFSPFHSSADSLRRLWHTRSRI